MRKSKYIILNLFKFRSKSQQDEAEEDQNLFEDEEEKKDSEDEGEDLLENMEKFYI